MKYNSSQSGYIALLSTLIISAVLIVISFAVSQAGFFSRFNGLDREYKQRSNQLAQACVNMALLQLVKNGSVSAGPVAIGNESCNIISVLVNTPGSGQITLQAKATVQQAVTNLQVVADISNLRIISWQELPTL